MSAVGKELDELTSWPGPGNRYPPGGSVLTWIIVGIAGTLLVSGLLLPGTERDLKVLCTCFGLALTLAASAFIQTDVAAVRERSLHAPAAALRYFLGQIRGLRFGSARTAVALHATEVARHVAFKDFWNGREGALRGLAVTGFEVVGVKSIVEDAALVRVKIHARPVALAAILGLWLGPLGYLAFALVGSRTMELSKLVVRRQGRWFLACGLPDESVDAALAKEIQRRAEEA